MPTYISDVMADPAAEDHGSDAWRD